MIEFVKEPIPAPLERSLRVWVSKPEAQTLVRVVAARCQLCQSEAIAAAESSKHESDAGDLLSQSAMRESMRYKAFLSVFEEIVTQNPQEKFFTVKLKPTQSTYGNTHTGAIGGEGSTEEG